MKPSIIVWDLETVPDLGGFAAAHDLVGKSDVEVREAIGDKFPKHIYHSIVCIGALIAHRESDYWAVDAVGAPHVGERTEKELTTAFCDKIAELSPQLVTFNGNSFDLPVLRPRGPRRGSRCVPTSTDTPRMLSICVTSSRHLVRRERPPFTKSAE
jgi:predicted PolB exonuclease-like 3'-5' exonuclease